MSEISLYDPNTGQFIGETRSGPRLQHLLANVPKGLSAIEGAIDHLSYRVDIKTGAVVDWQPPQPDADHEWNDQRRRWIKSAEVQQREQRRSQALERIKELEAKMLRPMLEDKLRPAERDPMDGKLPSERLQEIGAEIEQLRAVLSDRP